MARVLIGLGANLGNRKETISSALDHLRSAVSVTVASVSSLYESSAIGGPKDQPSFLNGVAVLQTDLSAEWLLELLQKTETSLGRNRREHWGSRTIDLDLLLYEDLQFAEPHLQIPHRWFPFRSFVLDPAVEVAAEFAHPGLNSTVAKLHENFYSPRPYCVMTGGQIGQRATLAFELAKRYDAYLVMTASTRAIVIADMPQLFENGVDNLISVDKRMLTERPILFLDDYMQPDFRPQKTWHTFRALQGQLVEQKSVTAPRSLIPKARLRLCDEEKCWMAIPNPPQQHWDYIRSVPVPTMNIGVKNSVPDLESAEIVLAICCEPQQFRTRRV